MTDTSAASQPSDEIDQDDDLEPSDAAAEEDDDAEDTDEAEPSESELFRQSEIAADYIEGLLDILDFDGDTTWVTRRTVDQKHRYRDNGWQLIDRTGRPLNENRYLGPAWAPRTDYHGTPIFVGDLACVALTETYDLSVPHPERRSAWGYLNRAGQIVAWHPSMEPNQPAARRPGPR